MDRPSPSGQIAPAATTPGAASVLASVVMLAALAQLLLFHMEPGAPLWNVPRGTAPQQATAATLARLDSRTQAAAAGGNLELHLVGFDPADPGQNLLMAAMYYRITYVLYPRQAWLGRGDRLLNYPQDMIAADQVPDPLWLRAHDVRNVQTLIRPLTGPVRELTQAVP